MTTDTDYEKTYNDHWKRTVENEDGTLNKDQVMRELSDYTVVMDNASLVYSEIANLSKPNTAAHHVLAAADDLYAGHHADDALDQLFDVMETAADKQAVIDFANTLSAGAYERYTADRERRAQWRAERDRKQLEVTVTDLNEVRELLARDLPTIDGILMGLLGEDQDALFAYTTDWEAAADQLPKLLTESYAENKRFTVTADSVRWAQLRRRPTATGDVDDPDWVVQFNDENGRPFTGDAVGAFQCVYAEEVWDL
jgi:hypothetical protein